MLAFSSPLQRRPDSDLTLLVVNPGVISYHDVAKKLGSKVEHVFDAFPGAGGGVGLSGHSTSLDVILPVVKPGGGGSQHLTLVPILPMNFLHALTQLYEAVRRVVLLRTGSCSCGHWISPDDLDLQFVSQS
jgi:hypothetical protein